MILRRLGNKSKLAGRIQEEFPPHKIYVEPFFGAGGMFFNKPLATKNFLNDLDSDVYNLWNIFMYKKDELIYFLDNTPYHEDVWNNWKANEELTDIRKAARFLYLSNFGYLGAPKSLHMTDRNSKQVLIENMNILKYKGHLCFSNKDFRKFIKSISLEEEKSSSVFVYCDPPYLGTNDNYSYSFKEADSLDLFNLLVSTGYNFAISEFNNPVIIRLAEERNLNIINLGERSNIKNRRTEILITNYRNTQQKLF